MKATISFSLLTKALINRSEKKLINYYEEAGPDYETWSPNYNMHFGYFEKGLNPLRREPMLEMMNAQVLTRLEVTPESGTIVDMGCGLSAALRHATNTYPQLKGVGVTLVPWQKKEAERLNRISNKADQIAILKEDYTKTSIPSNSVDYVIAMESSCYASGSAKSDLLSEIFRILKPGGRFCIGDGFLKSKRPMNPILKWSYKQLCKSWALQELGNVNDFHKAADSIGFGSLNMEDISWKVAPSVAHVPFTVIGFLLKQLFAPKRPMTKERWDNLVSPLLTMILGLHQKHFGYYLIQGEKTPQ